MLTRPNMRCLDCGYDLHGLKEHRCPECGRGFDPRQPATYLTRPVSGRGPLIVTIVAVLLIASPFLEILTDRLGWSKPGRFPGMILVSWIGFVLLFVVYEMTKSAARGKAPWVIHRRELMFAHVVSAAALVAGVLGGILVLISKWLTK